MDTISEKLQAILAKAAELHGTDILWHTPNETLYEAVNFYVCAQSAEIDRLKADNAELLLLRDMEHERCRVARQEVGRLKKALEEAELKLSLVWPGTWQPVDEDNEELPDLRADDDRGIFVHEDGRGIEFYCEGGELEGYFQLPEGYAVCRKVQP